MDRELLEILACPACHGAIAEQEKFLLCKGCGLRYRIEDGIAVLLIEEAQAAQKGA
ncbi:MAG TPA: Trm112 family protein [Candidatus Omnitrophota bacterium]|jgi:uncharacterized protein YbaR (Trm112 family)|nr:Trm112 family protein [Candidatus Omnitrophota bacterium]HSA30579.1 Trm112 family protein [Candidatus Omnitrophota bacterium]